jgi:hypothetical protein
MFVIHLHEEASIITIHLNTAAQSRLGVDGKLVRIAHDNDFHRPRRHLNIGHSERFQFLADIFDSFRVCTVNKECIGPYLFGGSIYFLDKIENEFGFYVSTTGPVE